MDSRQKKELIIELKDTHSMSFTEISSELLDKYDVRMSRQAVYGMYVRAKSSSSKVEKLEYTNKLIIRVYARTGSIINTVRCMEELIKKDASIQKEKCSYKYISRITADHIKEIEEVRGELKKCVIDLGYKDSSMEELKQILTFRGVEIGDDIMTSIITEIVIDNISEYTKNEIKSIIASCDGNTDIAKNIMRHLSENVLAQSVIKIRNEIGK